MSDALSALLPAAAQHARGKADRRALRVCAATARELARCYGVSRAGRVPDEAAAARPSRLPVRDLADLQQLVNRHTEELAATDPADTAAALTAAWYGFAVASCLGGFLAARDADRAVLHDNATPVIAGIVVALEAAPSLPAGIHGVGLDTEGEATDETMRTAHRESWIWCWHSTHSCRKWQTTPAGTPTAKPPRRPPGYQPSWATATRAASAHSSTGKADGRCRQPCSLPTHGGEPDL